MRESGRSLGQSKLLKRQGTRTMETRVHQQIPFELLDLEAKRLPVPVNAFSFYDDEHRDVVLVYEEELLEEAA